MEGEAERSSKVAKITHLTRDRFVPARPSYDPSPFWLLRQDTTATQTRNLVSTLILLPMASFSCCFITGPPA